jgi:hypothetical protein
VTEQERALIEGAREMREAQRAYYANPNRADLDRAKALERKFDKALADYLAGRTMATQPALFPGG